MNGSIPGRTTARAVLATLPVAAALLFGAASASAQTVTGCYVPNSGTVYRTKADGLPDKCRSAQHVEFSWGLQGPQGIPGPAGPAGPQGPQGLAGTATITAASVTHVTVPSALPAGVSNVVVTATCPAGAVATGGGASAESPIIVHYSSPHPSKTTWLAKFTNPPGGAIANATVFAVCVPAS